MSKKIYSRFSRFYDNLFGAILQPGHRIASELMNMQSGDRVLEVGIGTGISLPLYPDNVDVFGIDINEDMIKRAGEKKRRMGFSHVKLCLMDAAEMGFKNDYFDKVIASHSITVIPEPFETLKEIKRVCKKNAEFFFLNFGGSDDNIIARIEKASSSLRNRLGLGKAIDLEGLLRNADFTIDYKDRVSFFKFCKIIKCRNNGA